MTAAIPVLNFINIEYCGNCDRRAVGNYHAEALSRASEQQQNEP